MAKQPTTKRKGKAPKQILAGPAKKRLPIPTTKRHISLEAEDEFRVCIYLSDDIRKSIRERQKLFLLLRDTGAILDGTPREPYFERRLNKANFGGNDQADMFAILNIVHEEFLLRVAADNLLLKLLEFPRKVDLSTYERALFTFPALAEAAREESQYYVFKILRAIVEHCVTGEPYELEPDHY